LDRLQDAIDHRRRELAGIENEPPMTAPSSTVIERHAYGSGVLLPFPGTFFSGVSLSCRRVVGILGYEHAHFPCVIYTASL
jgi:hypothetical protein